jgi:hypothetical protein
MLPAAGADEEDFHQKLPEVLPEKDSWVTI